MPIINEHYNEATEYIDKLFCWNMEERLQSRDTKEIEDSYAFYCQTADGIVDGLSDKLWDAVCDYGQAREAQGFKDGFRLAFNLIHEAYAKEDRTA